MLRICYGRLDFKGKIPVENFEVVVNVESWAVGESRPRRALRVDASAREQRLTEWKIEEGKIENASEERALASFGSGDNGAKVALLRNFEFKLPLIWLLATPVAASGVTERNAGPTAVAATSKVRLRFSLWQNRLPVDSLPLEGWIELQVVSEGELLFGE